MVAAASTTQRTSRARVASCFQEPLNRDALGVPKDVARPERLELPTLGFEGRCSIQLSYGRVTRIVAYTARMATAWDNVSSRSDWLGGALARFEKDNADLFTATRALLERIVPAAQPHARLLNTLSLLEHMGSHKIMATQHSAGIDQATLRHVAEEAHHAYFMKHQAEKQAGRELEYVPADLLAPVSARMYFQRLEAKMKRTLTVMKNDRTVYLYMSLIVEFRALWFYGLYQQLLERLRQPLSLKRVLGEETHHLREIAAHLESHGELRDAHVAEFLATEKTLFARLVRDIERATV
jgi:hypothetical protein